MTYSPEGKGTFVEIPEWLQDSLYQENACSGDKYLILSNQMKSGNHCALVINNLSEAVIEKAAAKYYQDYESLEVEQKENVVSVIKDVIVSLLLVKAISVSPKFHKEISEHNTISCDEEKWELRKVNYVKMKYRSVTDDNVMLHDTLNSVELLPEQIQTNWEANICSSVCELYLTMKSKIEMLSTVDNKILMSRANDNKKSR